MNKIAVFQVSSPGHKPDFRGFICLPIEDITVLYASGKLVGPIKLSHRKAVWYCGSQYLLDSKQLKDRNGNWTNFPVLYLSPDCPYSPHDIFQDESFSTWI